MLQNVNQFQNKLKLCNTILLYQTKEITINRKKMAVQKTMPEREDK